METTDMFPNAKPMPVSSRPAMPSAIHDGAPSMHSPRMGRVAVHLTEWGQTPYGVHLPGVRPHSGSDPNTG